MNQAVFVKEHLTLELFRVLLNQHKSKGLQLVFIQKDITTTAGAGGKPQAT